MILRGASAEARVALRDRVEAVDAAELARLGDDLVGVADLLRSEPGLRRVATDPTTEADAKARLFRGILDGRVAAASLEIVVDAIGRRWTATRDLADTLEYLGVVAIVRSVSEQADRLSDELFAVGELISAEDGLRAALSDPVRSVEDKAALVRGLLEGKALPATVTLTVLALNGSHRTVNVALTEYQKIAAGVYGESVATVQVARDLDERDRARLIAALTEQYGRPVHLNVMVDPELVGGMRVEIGDDVIDGSVSARLDDARRLLAS